MHVTFLLQPPRGVGEGEAGDRGAGPVRAEFACEQPGPGEAQRVGEEEQDVVARDGGARALADQPRRGVADERVGDGEAVAHRPERVGLEEPRRLMGERVTVPRDLPGLHERVAEVLRDVAAHVQRQRPVHREREHDPEQRHAEQLTAGQPRARGLGHACMITAAEPARRAGTGGWLSGR